MPISRTGKKTVHRKLRSLPPRVSFPSSTILRTSPMMPTTTWLRTPVLSWWVRLLLSSTTRSLPRLLLMSLSGMLCNGCRREIRWLLSCRYSHAFFPFFFWIYVFYLLIYSYFLSFIYTFSFSIFCLENGLKRQGKHPGWLADFFFQFLGEEIPNICSWPTNVWNWAFRNSVPMWWLCIITTGEMSSSSFYTAMQCPISSHLCLSCFIVSVPPIFLWSVRVP